MKKLLICVDLDGVVCDLLGPLVKRFNQVTANNIEVKNIVTWKLPDGMKEIMYEYPYIFSKLPLIGGALDGLRALKEDGHELVFVTCASKNSAIAYHKINWYYEQGLDNYGEIIISSNKGIIEGDVLIDDAYHNCTDFVTSRSGLDKRAILVDHPYNWSALLLPTIKRALDWPDILRKVADIANESNRSDQREAAGDTATIRSHGV